MKKLICEICGGTDLIKQDGAFVCRSCGTKYSLEEAKKIMIEDSLDVGVSTVKVDTSDELINLYQIARRAKDSKNNENAAKYYDMILIKDPSSWEANFYTVYFKSMLCKIAEIQTAAIAVNNCIESTFLLIKENVFNNDERKKVIKEVYEKASNISEMLFQAAISHVNNIDPLVRENFKAQYLNSAIAAAGIKKTACDKMCEIFKDDDDVLSNVGIQILKSRISEGIAIDASEDYIMVIKKYDPSYLPPKNQTVSEIMKSGESLNNNGGCYIATSVYGSYDCPQVWTLRRFRDYTLVKTWYGRTFIRTYYAISPMLVKWFSQTKWFKKMWRGKLNRMVKMLNAKGVENTPYKDKIGKR